MKNGTDKIRRMPKALWIAAIIVAAAICIFLAFEAFTNKIGLFAPAIKSINIDDIKGDIYINGYGRKLTYTTRPNVDKSRLKPEWSTSDENIAKIENGNVIGISEGICYIYVKCGKCTDRIQVSVTYYHEGAGRDILGKWNAYMINDEPIPEEKQMVITFYSDGACRFQNPTNFPDVDIHLTWESYYREMGSEDRLYNMAVFSGNAKLYYLSYSRETDALTLYSYSDPDLKISLCRGDNP